MEEDYNQNGIYVRRLFGIVFIGFFITTALSIYIGYGIAMLHLKSTDLSKPKPENLTNPNVWIPPRSFSSVMISLLSYSVSVLWFWMSSSKELRRPSETKFDAHRWSAKILTIIITALTEIGIGCVCYVNLEASFLEIIVGYILGWIIGWMFIEVVMSGIYPEWNKGFKIPEWFKRIAFVSLSFIFCHFVHHGDEHEDMIMEQISENLGELE